MTIVIEVGRLWRCLVLLEVRNMSYVLLSFSFDLLAVAQYLIAITHESIEGRNKIICQEEQTSLMESRQQMNSV